MNNPQLLPFFGVRTYLGGIEFSSGGVACQGLNVRVEPYPAHQLKPLHRPVRTVGTTSRRAGVTATGPARGTPSGAC
eukprot:8775889-Pyramimonas_sp.AAC.1